MLVVLRTRLAGAVDDVAFTVSHTGKVAVFTMKNSPVGLEVTDNVTAPGEPEFFTYVIDEEESVPLSGFGARIVSVTVIALSVTPAVARLIVPV
jgi:hypothetical protein